MKHGTHTLLLQMAAVLSLFLLNSCYFNSAGHILDNASYKAAVDMADAKPGKSVYTDGTHYYIELPRYKAGKPVKTQYSILDQEQEKPRTDQLRLTSEHTLVRIPEDYALYLTGQSQTPAKPSSVTPVNKDEDEIKQRCRKLAVTRQPEADLTLFPYKSAWPGGWQMLAALDWLCVDLPITCVENSLMICGITLYAICEGAQGSSSGTSASTNTSSASTSSTSSAAASTTSSSTSSPHTIKSSAYDFFSHAQKPTVCEDTGKIIRKSAYMTRPWDVPTGEGYRYEQCNKCLGSGYHSFEEYGIQTGEFYYCKWCNGSGWRKYEVSKTPPGLLLLKGLLEHKSGSR